MTEYELAFSVALEKIAMYKANPPKLTERYVRGYATICKAGGVSQEDIPRVSMQICVSNENRFFPQPSEFIDVSRLSCDSWEMKLEQAWRNVRDAVSRLGSMATFYPEDVGDDAHALLAMSRVGTKEIGAMTEETRLFKRKEFERNYKLAIRTGAGLSKLQGEWEIANLSMGYSGMVPGMLGRKTAKETKQLEANNAN